MRFEGKKIILTKPISVRQIHSTLQEEAFKQKSKINKFLGISNANPSKMIIPSHMCLCNGWHIDESTIKYIEFGSWEDNNNKYIRLEILGTEIPLEPGRLKTDGEVFKGMPDIDRGSSPAYYIKNGTYFSLRGKHTFKNKIDSGMVGQLVAPVPFGKSLSQTLENL